MAYTCPACGRTSHHLKDAEERFCGACNRFEDDPVPRPPAFEGQRHEVTWLDSGLEPACAANRAYPHGIDLVVPARAGPPRCKIDQPYPAKRCGAYLVNCLACGTHTRVSTAGRADDPRSVTVPCSPAAA